MKAIKVYSCFPMVKKKSTNQQFSSQKSQNEKEILTLFCLFIFQLLCKGREMKW